MQMVSRLACPGISTALMAGFGLMALVNTSWAADPVPISGSFDCTYTKQQVSPVGKAEEAHILMLSGCEGKNSNSSATNYMEGASVQDQEIADLAQGNGPQIGYSTFTLGPDGIRVRYEGQISTTLNPDKTPNTTFKGNWAFISGMGQYAGVGGRGTYTGKKISDSILHVDWVGSYSLGPQPSAALQ